jgi:hypothetical protein
MVEETPPNIDLSRTWPNTEPHEDVIDLTRDGAELFQTYKHAQSTLDDLNSRQIRSYSENPTTVPDDESISLVTRLSAPMLQAVKKVGSPFYHAIIAINLLGLFVLAMSFRDSKSSARTGNTGPQTSENASRASKLAKKLKEISQPTNVQVPLFSAIAIFTFTLNGLNTIQVDQGSAYDGTRAFQTTCPEEGRRTQEAVLVKLFAATVTTLGINGHLGSLSGSTSWRRELVRALEVIVVPLTAVFQLTVAIFYELSTAAFSMRTWPDDVGIRYRLARMCCYQVPLASNQDREYVGDINIRHLKMTDLTRDLKYYGRMFFLIVLLAQCIQTSILLTRRIVSHTTASVDLALMFLVISSMTALLQSFTISGVNVKWTLRDDIQPCLEKSCRLSDCIDFKKNQGMPVDNFPEFKLPFGRRFITQIPKRFLYASTAGFLQVQILADKCGTPYKNIVSFLGIYLYWRLSIYFLLYCWVLHGIFFDPKNSVFAHNTASNDDNTSPPNLPTINQQPPASTAAHNQQPAAENPTLKISDLLVYALGTSVGILFASVGSFAVLFQPVMAFGPFIIMYFTIGDEVSAWGSADSGNPCPQLWKDGLEDMLWLF